MKLRNSPLFAAILAGPLAALLASHSAQAQSTYYWDNNGSTAGFGTAAGTWAVPTTGDATQGWSTDAAGVTLPVNITTAAADTLNFGTATASLAAGTITVIGTVDSGNMTFASGAGAIVLSGGIINLATTATITVDNSSDTISSAISGAGTSLIKAGTGPLILGGTNTFTGGLKLDGGTLRYTADQTTSVGALTFGATLGSTNVSTLDLSTTPSSLIASGLTLQTNNNSTTTNNAITIGSGKTLTINGNVSSYVPTAQSTANLTVSGLGAMSVASNSSTAVFQVGGGSGTTYTLGSLMDFSALSNFTLNYSNASSILNVGFLNNGSNGGTASSLYLGKTGSVTVGTLNLGVSRQSGTYTLQLGNAANTLNVATLNIGTAAANNRGKGSVNFAAGDSTGTLNLYGQTGSGSRADVNMDMGGGSGSANSSIFDVRGHTANIYIGTLSMGSATTTAHAPVFKFDKGTLDITTANLGVLATTGAVNGTLQIGTDSSSTGAATIASLVLANNKSTGNLNLLGGTLTMGGDIILGATTPGTGTVKVSGGTLDMASHSIGTATALVILTAESGTIQNVTTINGTGGLTKTTAGTLTLSGTNTYTGTTTVSGGTLTLSGTGSINPTTGATLTLGAAASAGTSQYDSSAASTFGNLLIGNGTSNNGNLTQTAGTINATTLQLSTTVASSGLGTANLSGGKMILTDSAWIGERTNIAGVNSGTLNVSGTAELNITGAMKLGADINSDTRNGGGTVNQTGGTVTIAGGLVLTGTTGLAANTRIGTYNLDGGTLNVNQISQAAAGVGTQTGTCNFNGGTLKATADNATFMQGLTTANVKDGGAKIDTGGFDITIAQPLVNFSGATTDSLTKSGAGNLTLTGANTYTGATSVNAGTLKIGAAGTIASSSSLTLSAGAILDTTAQSTFTLSASQPVSFKVDGSGSGSSGRISAAGIDITSAVVSFNIVNPLDDAAYVLASYTSRSGAAFASATPPGGYTIDYSYSGGTQIALVKSGSAGFSSWIDTNFPALSDKSAGGDPDNDGISNLLEYVLNGNPGAADTSILPALSVTPTSFVFTFHRLDESEADTTLTFQYGATLGSWENVTIGAVDSGPDVNGVTVGVVENGTAPDGITVTVPRGSNTKLFGRLRVTQP